MDTSAEADGVSGIRAHSGPQGRDREPAVFETGPLVFGGLLYHVWDGWSYLFVSLFQF